MMFYTRFDSPLWEIILVGNEEGLTKLHMTTGEGKREFEIESGWERNDSLFRDARVQLLEYFEGKRRQFDLLLKPHGTDFQKIVWKALTQIPYGEVHTYKEVATAIGNPKGSRAVGMANSKNPLPIIVPCHRVIGANGSLTGFAHGVNAKETLLKFERS